VTLAQDYLKRCGRWRVRLNVTLNDPWYTANSSTYENESTRDFFIQWAPGDGQWGIAGSTIEGSGPVDATHIVHNTVCSVLISDIHPTRDAEARIVLLAFDHFEVPILHVPIPAQPAKLTLAIGLGSSAYRYGCAGDIRQEHDEDFGTAVWTFTLAQGQTVGLQDLIDIAKGERDFTVDRGWRFSTGPYKASNVVEGNFDLTTGKLVPTRSNATYSDRLEAIVEHEPL
jgi:hypothetical protein